VVSPGRLPGPVAHVAPVGSRSPESRISPKRRWEDVETGRAATVDTVYGEARSACPIAAVRDGDGPGFWAVLGHDLLLEVVADTATFSNVVPLYPTRRPPLESDPPEHTAYRHLLAAHFSSRRTAMLEPMVREFVREMLRPLLIADRADFAGDFAGPLPTRVLCHLLGIPDTDWRLINDLSARLHRIGAERRDNTGQRAELGAALRDYASGLIAARRQAAPRDDVIGALLEARIEDAPLTDATITGMVMMLISAGHNTTTSLLGNAVLRLARDPREQQRLRDAPGAIPAAIEECLRLESPQQAMPRVATRDIELAGCPIRAGDHVWPVFGAANLDPAAFDPPLDYRPDRYPNRHLAFGKGLHRCVGAPLAQLQGRVVLEELLAATSAITVAGPVTRPAWPRMGVSSLPLRLDPRP
jgi:cytochrome P450